MCITSSLYLTGKFFLAHGPRPRLFPRVLTPHDFQLQSVILFSLRQWQRTLFLCLVLANLPRPTHTVWGAIKVAEQRRIQSWLECFIWCYTVLTPAWDAHAPPWFRVDHNPLLRYKQIFPLSFSRGCLWCCKDDFYSFGCLLISKLLVATHSLLDTLSLHK